MDHIVYLDARARELDKLLAGEKTMIVRGAAGRKLPYGRVSEQDRLFLVNNNGDGLVRAAAVVRSVFNSPQLTPGESVALLEGFRNELQLTPEQLRRWSGKRYLVLIGIGEIEEQEPFAFAKGEFSNMDDWLPVGEIETVRR